MSDPCRTATITQLYGANTPDNDVLFINKKAAVFKLFRAGGWVEEISM